MRRYNPAMVILGLHFGHDAGVSIVQDGVIRTAIVRERHARIKHAISLQCRNIDAALAASHLRADQIDYVAITSTQNLELIIDDGKRFNVDVVWHPGHTAPCSLDTILRAQNADVRRLLVHSLADLFYDPAQRDSLQYRHFAPGFPEHQRLKVEQLKRFGWIDTYITRPDWTGATLSQLAASNPAHMLVNEEVRNGFHYPVTVTLDGRNIPGYYIAHHAAHAASTFYQSGFPSAAIMTHDGFGRGTDYRAGMFLWGEKNRIYPISPNYLTLGGFYETVSYLLGLGYTGGPGKLMGLAAYGNPRFFDRLSIGNFYDWKKNGFTTHLWWEQNLRLARALKYDISALADVNRMTAPVNIDIAATAQKILEEGMLAAAETLGKMLALADRITPNLCLSGGVALNCPANSRIFREGPFRNVYVEPGCDDSGLAVGAALFLTHNVLEQPIRERPSDEMATPYLGAPIEVGQIEHALVAAGLAVQFARCADAAESAATDLAENKVIAWFEGRSEIGPRALGHRSILADARHADNWPRVNRLKGREAWRPFAPAVLESQAANWFSGAPLPSPYMLFTATVRTTQLPAITHADGTARIQTVGPDAGEFFRLLEHYFEKTGIPVIMNTSFNGPGEPIVETPADAIRFLVNSDLDALYMDGFRVIRARENDRTVSMETD